MVSFQTAAVARAETVNLSRELGDEIEVLSCALMLPPLLFAAVCGCQRITHRMCDIYRWLAGVCLVVVLLCMRLQARHQESLIKSTAATLMTAPPLQVCTAERECVCVYVHEYVASDQGRLYLAPSCVAFKAPIARRSFCVAIADIDEVGVSE